MVGLKCRVLVGDVDGDGDLDLVFGNEGQQNHLFLNDGKGSFTDATNARLPKDRDFTQAVALGELDGDGDLDLVIGNKEENRLYINLHRQIHAPFLAILGRSYQFDFYGKPGYARVPQFVLPYLSLAPAIPPIKVPPFGSFGLSLVGLISLRAVALRAPAGKASIRLTIPPIPALQGLTLYWQAFAIQPQESPQVRLTSVVADRILK